MRRPFFLPCLLAALISAVALVSNTFMLTETLPRIVQARAAGHAADQKDETAPLLAAEDGQSRSDCEGELQWPSATSPESHPVQDIPSAFPAVSQSKPYASIAIVKPSWCFHNFTRWNLPWQRLPSISKVWQQVRQ